MDETGFGLLRDRLDSLHGARYGRRYGPFHCPLGVRALQEPDDAHEAT